MNTALLKPAEVAHELRVSRATVYNLIKSGELETVRIGPGAATRIEPAAVERYIARHRKDGAA